MVTFYFVLGSIWMAFKNAGLRKSYILNILNPIIRGGKILKKNSFVTRMSSLGSSAKPCIKCYSMHRLWEAICFMSIRTKISHHCHEKSGEMSSFQLATWSFLRRKVPPIILTFPISTDFMCNMVQTGKSVGKDSKCRGQNILYESVSSLGHMMKFYQRREFTRQLN